MRSEGAADPVSWPCKSFPPAALRYERLRKTSLSRTLRLAMLLASLPMLACQDAIVVGHTAGRGGGSSDALGLWGDYWDNAELAGPAGYSRIDPILDTVWEGSPAPGISAVFSARWRGYLLPLADESHELTLESDDGSRLWLGENLLIDQWQGAPNKGSATVNLRADTPVELRVELYSTGGNAALWLRWASASLPTQIVPGDRFRLP